MRRSGLPRSRLRGSGHRRGSPFRTSRSSSVTSALILLRQRANVSPVAPAARSSFHRARIAAISSTSGRSIFVFVMASSIGGRPLKTRCLFGGEQVRWSSTPIPPSLKVLYVDQVVLTFRIINHKWCWPISCPYRSSPASIPLNWRLGRLWGGFPFALRFSHKLPVGRGRAYLFGAYADRQLGPYPVVVVEAAQGNEARHIQWAGRDSCDQADVKRRDLLRVSRCLSPHTAHLGTHIHRIACASIARTAVRLRRRP